MTAPTLMVLAAGMGSRYGGVKQMDPVGPNGEFVLDYSMYDAWRAGFDRVVMVIRPELEEPLRDHVAGGAAARLHIVYVNQRLDDLPAGFEVPAERVKPWGTGHAIWSAREAVASPFAVINADDFYGADALRSLADFLSSPSRDARTYAMVAYRLANTLSDHGSVSRGICTVDERGYLEEVVERTRIERTDQGIGFRTGDGGWHVLTGDEPASLNLWGFGPAVFPALGVLFAEFLEARRQDAKAEFFIPTAVDTLIRRDACRTAVLHTDEHWFGMTYREDHAVVAENIRRLTEAGQYPASLWG